MAKRLGLQKRATEQLQQGQKSLCLVPGCRVLLEHPLQGEVEQIHPGAARHRAARTAAALPPGPSACFCARSSQHG